jgi:hypothetical protein
MSEADDAPAYQWWFTGFVSRKSIRISAAKGNLPYGLGRISYLSLSVRERKIMSQEQHLEIAKEFLAGISEGPSKLVGGRENSQAASSTAS